MLMQFMQLNIQVMECIQLPLTAKIKRITIPLPDGKMLFISVSNKPMKNAKNTSYGHLVQMGEILSIVEFVESQNF